MDLSRKLSILVIALCILISLKNQSSHQCDPSSSANCCLAVSSAEKKFLEVPATESEHSSLRYDFYHESCPLAEQIIRSTVHDEYAKNPLMVPAILRMAFHDCFVQGCDASILLDAIEGMNSEKDIIPNRSLKGFTLIDTVKARLEETCPGVVSCADIVVLAARESVAAAGGPFYPLLTGRRDSEQAFSDEANLLPGPDEHLASILDKFATKGFDERETVSLLGSHSTGRIHCQFMRKRLSDEQRGDDNPIDADFLQTLRLKCNGSHPQSAPPPSLPSASSSVLNLSSTSADNGTGVINMDIEGPGNDFGTLYFRNLLQKKGLLFADQQLTARQDTLIWVQAYASDASLFRRDFAAAMIKLSSLHVLTAPDGQIRLTCGKMN